MKEPDLLMDALKRLSFYATMKLVTGEEVITEVMANDEKGDEEFFVLGNPIVIGENTHLDTEKGVVIAGLVPKKWMLYANDDITIVYKQHVVSISELDKFGTDFYKKALIAAKVSCPIKKKVDSEKHTGYVGKIEALRKLLQRSYDDSPDLAEE